MKCAYCELPEIKKRQIVANDLAWAFLGNMPIVPGHALVSPKRCVPKYEDLTHYEREAVEELRMLVCASLKKTFGAEGFNFAWNDGKDCGQSVPHFHLHIVPRKKGDTGIYEYEPRQFLYRLGERAVSPETELQEVTRLIRENM